MALDVRLPVPNVPYFDRRNELHDHSQKIAHYPTGCHPAYSVFATGVRVELIHYEKRQSSLTAKGKQLQKDLYLLQREIAKVEEQLTSTVEHTTLHLGLP